MKKGLKCILTFASLPNPSDELNSFCFPLMGLKAGEMEEVPLAKVSTKQLFSSYIGSVLYHSWDKLLCNSARAQIQSQDAFCPVLSVLLSPALLH